MAVQLHPGRDACLEEFSRVPVRQKMLDELFSAWKIASIVQAIKTLSWNNFLKYRFVIHTCSAVFWSFSGEIFHAFPEDEWKKNQDLARGDCLFKTESWANALPVFPRGTKQKL